MLRVGATLGALLDDADRVVQRLEAMQNALVSILDDLKSGKTSIEEVEITRNPQGEVVGVNVNRENDG